MDGRSKSLNYCTTKHTYVLCMAYHHTHIWITASELRCFCPMHMRVDVVWGYPAPKVMSMTRVLQVLGMCHVSQPCEHRAHRPLATCRHWNSTLKLMFREHLLYITQSPSLIQGTECSEIFREDGLPARCSRQINKGFRLSVSSQLAQSACH